MQVHVINHERRSLATLVCALLLSSAPAAVAQLRPLRDIPAPHAPAEEITLKASGPSPVTAPESWIQMGNQRVVQNVSIPSLYVFLPLADKATGTAVVIAPGGGFFMLSMDSEGWSVARWLQSQGIAAFVLKYRLQPSTPGTVGLLQSFTKLISPMAGPNGPSDLKTYLAKGTLLATEDAKEAMRVVRARAAEWKIDPARIGFMGFSAGAFTALNLVYTSDRAREPAFIGVIYGPMGAPAQRVPVSPPPMWAALASDDPLLGKTDFALINAWRAKGGEVEFHLYEKGGHGFGFPGREGTTTMHWSQEFLWWLKSQGLLTPPNK